MEKQTFVVIGLAGTRWSLWSDPDFLPLAALIQAWLEGPWAWSNWPHPWMSRAGALQFFFVLAAGTRMHWGCQLWLCRIPDRCHGPCGPCGRWPHNWTPGDEGWRRWSVDCGWTQSASTGGGRPRKWGSAYWIWNKFGASIFQWIGLRENLQETIDFPIQYGWFL